MNDRERQISSNDKLRRQYEMLEQQQRVAAKREVAKRRRDRAWAALLIHLDLLVARENAR